MACLSKPPATLSSACSSFTENQNTYFNTYSECATATGASDCANQVLTIHGKPQLCFFSPSFVSTGSSTPPNLSFESALIDAGTVSSVQTRTFYVKNSGSRAATGCKVILSGQDKDFFSVISSSPFTVLPSLRSAVIVRLEYVANQGMKAALIEVDCDEPATPATSASEAIETTKATIRAAFGTSQSGTQNQGPVLSLDLNTTYLIPSFSKTNSPNNLEITLKNTGAIQASGCIASMVDPVATNFAASNGINISGASFVVPPLGGTMKLTLAVNWAEAYRTAKLRVYCSGSNTNFLSSTFAVAGGTNPPGTTPSPPPSSSPSPSASPSTSPSPSPTPSGMDFNILQNSSSVKTVQLKYTETNVHSGCTLHLCETAFTGSQNTCVPADIPTFNGISTAWEAFLTESIDGTTRINEDSTYTINLETDWENAYVLKMSPSKTGWSAKVYIGVKCDSYFRMSQQIAY